MLISQMTVFASKDVTITVSSDGATKEEAIAYRKYLEEVYYEPVKEKYEQMRKESE